MCVISACFHDLYDFSNLSLSTTGTWELYWLLCEEGKRQWRIGWFSVHKRFSACKLLGSKGYARFFRRKTWKFWYKMEEEDATFFWQFTWDHTVWKAKLSHLSISSGWLGCSCCSRTYLLRVDDRTEDALLMKLNKFVCWGHSFQCSHAIKFLRWNLILLRLRDVSLLAWRICRSSRTTNAVATVVESTSTLRCISIEDL